MINNVFSPHHVDAKPAKVDQEVLDNITKAKAAKSTGTEFVYDDRDVILYSEYILLLSYKLRKAYSPSRLGCWRKAN
jgi:hypothetical protein